MVPMPWCGINVIARKLKRARISAIIREAFMTGNDDCFVITHHIRQQHAHKQLGAYREPNLFLYTATVKHAAANALICEINLKGIKGVFYAATCANGQGSERRGAVCPIGCVSKYESLHTQKSLRCLVGNACKIVKYSD